MTIKQKAYIRLLKSEGCLNTSTFEKKARKTIFWLTVTGLIWLNLILGISEASKGVTYTFENPSWSTRQPQIIAGSLPMAAENGKAMESGAPVEIVKKAAKKYGIDWRIIYAICKKESGCNPHIDCTKQGGRCDNNHSAGAYQIYLPAHPDVARADAEDFEWATDWTANRLRLKEDKWGTDVAIMLHNGSPLNPAVKQYLADVKTILATL